MLRQMKMSNERKIRRPELQRSENSRYRLRKRVGKMKREETRQTRVWAEKGPSQSTLPIFLPYSISFFWLRELLDIETEGTESLPLGSIQMPLIVSKLEIIHLFSLEGNTYLPSSFYSFFPSLLSFLFPESMGISVSTLTSSSLEARG